MAVRMVPSGTIVSRYTAGARVNHWITAISLILLAISGLSLYYPSLYFLTALFGGGQLTRIIHPWLGCLLLVSFAGLCVRVNAILQELKRQGDQRAADAKRIIALLGRLAESPSER